GARRILHLSMVGGQPADAAPLPSGPAPSRGVSVSVPACRSAPSPTSRRGGRRTSRYRPAGVAARPARPAVPCRPPCPSCPCRPRRRALGEPPNWLKESGAGHVDLLLGDVHLERRQGQLAH